jgi:hypothetical protein
MWKYPNGVPAVWWRVVLAYIALTTIGALVVVWFWQSVREEPGRAPTRTPAIPLTQSFYEEEFGSRGPGYYYYAFPNWGECVQSGGYVVSRGTSGDDPVTCRFYYSGP